MTWGSLGTRVLTHPQFAMIGAWFHIGRSPVRSMSWVRLAHAGQDGRGPTGRLARFPALQVVQAHQLHAKLGESCGSSWWYLIVDDCWYFNIRNMFKLEAGIEKNSKKQTTQCLFVSESVMFSLSACGVEWIWNQEPNKPRIPAKTLLWVSGLLK